ncbi:hypothetical protein MKW94_012131 [Papaver nudicaule]|uniref:MLO-like protein n=1 Tax=Papaver nudicaule TaxID=74823 RepID=A0AA41W210_PAPNU|nr:hypothetical protein [Papaver nudicaule]
MATPAAPSEASLEFTPTWVVALVCLIIVFISLAVERVLHHIGNCLKRKDQDALFEALQKLKEELMLLGFISLLLTVSQGPISRICIPEGITNHMLPCKKEEPVSDGLLHYSQAVSPSTPSTMWNGRRLLATGGGGTDHCSKHGKVPLLSIEALHQLHIFIFVLAVVHVFFCATTMFLGGLKIQQWKQWEDSIREVKGSTMVKKEHVHRHIQYFRQRANGFWRKSVVISWIMSFIKQFLGSVTKSDYIAMRSGFIMVITTQKNLVVTYYFSHFVGELYNLNVIYFPMQCHCPSNPDYNFHKYMLRTLEYDFKRVVGIRMAHILLDVILTVDCKYFLLFLFLADHILMLSKTKTKLLLWCNSSQLLLVVGAKLEHIITQLAEDISGNKPLDNAAATVKPSDKHFWFSRPDIVFYLIHFILFQNAFEIAFFFWIWSTYGFNSCILEKLGYIIPRLIIGVIVQVLCSYSTLPLYAIVTQMGSRFKQGIFEDHVSASLQLWREGTIRGGRRSSIGSSNKNRNTIEMQKMDRETFQRADITERTPATLEGIITQITEVPDPYQNQLSE